MKKIAIILTTVVAFTFFSCGPSAQEKASIQRALDSHRADSINKVKALAARTPHYKTLHFFDAEEFEGHVSGLILSGNLLYGVSGNHIFSMDTNGNGYKVLFDLGTMKDTDGSPLYFEAIAQFQLSGNVLYGMADGRMAKAWIFSINTNGSGFKKLIDLKDGYIANNSLLLIGNVLYGIMQSGGRQGGGYIFSVNTDGSGYKDLFDFGDEKIGSCPCSPLTLSGNKFYGITAHGGLHNMGCIFSINTNGSEYKRIYNINYSDNINDYGALTALGSVLYGISGDHIFSINIDGGQFKALPNYQGYEGRGISLTLSGSMFYGIIGANQTDEGAIFFDNVNGTRGTLLTFGNTNGEYGLTPDGTLIISQGCIFGVRNHYIGPKIHWADIYVLWNSNIDNYDRVDNGTRNYPDVN